MQEAQQLLFIDFLVPEQTSIKITCLVQGSRTIQQLKPYLEEQFHKLFPNKERIKINSVYALKEFLVPLEYESLIFVKDLFPQQSVITVSCEWIPAISQTFDTIHVPVDQEQESNRTSIQKRNSSSQQIIVEEEMEENQNNDEPPSKKQKTDEQDEYLKQLNEAKAFVQDKISQKKNLTKEEKLHLRSVYENLPEKYRHELKALFAKHK